MTRSAAFSRAQFLPKYTNPLLGFFATDGYASANKIDDLLLDATPNVATTAAIERHGPYAAAGDLLGMRACCQRTYGAGMTEVLASGNGTDALRTSSRLYKSMASGHVPLFSAGPANSGFTSAQLDTTSFWTRVMNGTFDAAFKAFFTDIEAFDWGGQVDTALQVFGAAWGGTKPLEFWFFIITESNINYMQGGSGSTPGQVAGALKHIMLLYDGMTFPGGKHIYFSQNMSATNLAAFQNHYDYLGPNDITGFGVRACDAYAPDIYYPSPEVNGGNATAANETAFGVSSKYGSADSIRTTYFPDNTPCLIPEYALRIPTDGGAPDGSDPTWPATWFSNSTFTLGGTTYSGLRKYIADRPMSNGGASLRLLSQFCSVDGTTTAGVTPSSTMAGDNTICPGMTTATGRPYQNAGIKTQPSFTAYRGALAAWTNPFMPGSGQGGHTPASVYADAPALGALSTLLHFTPTAGETVKIYKDGVNTQTMPAGSTSTTIFATGSTLPQSHDWSVSGIGTNGVESAQSAPATTVAFNPVAGVVPSVPTGLTVPLTTIGVATAIASCTANQASENVTGYEWAADGDTTNRYETGSPSVVLGQGSNSGGFTFPPLTSDADHTVAVRAVNIYGPSSWSTAVVFHTAAKADITPPFVPAAPSLNGTVTSSAVPLIFTAVLDQTVTGSVTSGLSNYLIGRSATNNLAGAQPSTADILLSPTTTTPTDLNPRSSVLAPLDSWYFVAAKDNAGNVSKYGVGLQVTVPQQSVPVGPTAILSQTPAGHLVDGSAGLFALTSSVPGTAGPIVGYKYDFGDGTVFDFDGSLQRLHAFPGPGQWTVTGWVKDATGHISNPATLPVIVDPVAGPATNYAKIPYVIKGAEMHATDVNNPFDIIDGFLQTGAVTADTLQRTLTAVGNPLSARRYGGADFISLDPPSATSELILAAGLGYVIRCPMRPSALFATARWIQTAASPSTVTGAMFAIFDVAGKLISADGGDASSQWGRAGPVPCTFTIPGGAFDVPVGDDDPLNPCYQCFLYFYLATVGATPPRMAAGASTGAGNIATTSPATPSQANIDTCPLYSTCANPPRGALQPPLTLGALTALNASPLVVLL